MKITEVRVKMVSDGAERLRAFCSVTFDGAFVIRDLKVIDGANGPFVAMPSRKLTDRCSKCGCKNHLRARFCNDCGQRLSESRAMKDDDGRMKLHADIAHPINADCREMVQQAVLDAFEAECEAMKDPDYVPNHEETYEFEDDEPFDSSRESERAGGNSFEEFLSELRPAIAQSGGKSHTGRVAESRPVEAKSSHAPADRPDRQKERSTSPDSNMATGAASARAGSPVRPPAEARSKQEPAKRAESPPAAKAPVPRQQDSDAGFAAGLF